MKAYKCGYEEPKNVDSITSVQMAVKNLIYPTAKFLSDSEYDYDQPNFANDGPKSQSVRICEKLLKKVGKSGYTIGNKVRWWLAYRKIIRRKIGRLRQSDVRSVQEDFVKGILIFIK